MFWGKRDKGAAEEGGASRLFMLAVRSGSLGSIRTFLGKHPDLELRDRSGRSALMIAAAAGQMEVCELLLKAGASPDAKDLAGSDAAQHATQSGRSDIALLIRRHHAGELTGNVTRQAPSTKDLGSTTEPASFEQHVEVFPIDPAPGADHPTVPSPLVEEPAPSGNDHPQASSPALAPAEPVTPAGSSAALDPVPTGAPDSQAELATVTSTPLDPGRSTEVFDLSIPAAGAAGCAQPATAHISSREDEMAVPAVVASAAAAEGPDPLENPSSDAASYRSPPDAALLMSDQPGTETPKEEIDLDDLGGWVVDESALERRADTSAIRAASEAQARLSNRQQISGQGDDWSAITIDLPSSGSFKGDVCFPDGIRRWVADVLGDADFTGEYQDTLVHDPAGMPPSAAAALRTQLGRTAAAAGCIIDRPPDAWSLLTCIPGHQFASRAKIDELVDYAEACWAAVSRPAPINLQLDAMPVLDRDAENDLFARVRQAHSEAMLELARAQGAIDCVLAAELLRVEGKLSFDFISSHEPEPAAEEIDPSSDRPAAVGDEEAHEEVEAAEPPPAYLSGISTLQNLRSRQADTSLPAEARRAAQALGQLALTPAFLAHIARELVRSGENGKSMSAAFAAMRRAERARSTIIERHLPRLREFAERFVGQGLESDDLLQEGTFGLMRAIETFAPERGNRFWTYAQMWCWQRITRSIAELGGAIRLPVHVREKQRSLLRTMRAAEAAGRPLTVVELAEETGMRLELVVRLMRIKPVEAIEEISELEADGVAGAALISREPAPDELAMRQALSTEVHRILTELDPRVAEILRLRFGIDREEHTLEEVGRLYGVTRERIRQIEAKALNRLRPPTRSRALRSFRD